MTNTGDIVDLRESVASAFEQAEKEAATPVEQPTTPEVVEPPKTEEPKVETPAEPAKVEEPKQEEPKVEAKVVQPNTPAKVATEKPVKTENAPSSWKNGAKQAWANLPDDVKIEVHRREREFQRYIQESSTARNVYDQLGQILQPHMENFTKANLHPLAVVNNLLSQGRVLWQGSPEDKAKMVTKIILDCEIDPVLLDKELAGSLKARQDPNVNYVKDLLQQELGPIKNMVSQFQQPQQSPEEDPAMVRELEEFANQHPHFYDIKDDIADLLEISAKRGQPLTLENAYSKALAMHPEFTPKPADPINLSVSGAPANVGRPSADPSDLRGTLMSAFDNLRV